MPLAEITACWELVSYCPSLLQLQPSVIKLLPSTRNSIPETGFCLLPAFLMSLLLTTMAAFLLSSIYSWSKGRGFSSVSIQRKTHLLLFQSRNSSLLCYESPSSPALRLPWFPLEGISRRHHDLLKITYLECCLARDMALLTDWMMIAVILSATEDI